ncbi:MAG: cation:H+ antiporter [Crocinitomicaceae bacterium]
MAASFEYQLQLMDYVFLLLGLVVLIFGGEFLVKGAVGFSTAMKVSPLIVGMTIVAFGTSAPELLVSLTSALDGNPGIAVGNVVGSNIANIALVLGITVLIFPIIADKHTKRIDLPVMIFSTLLFVYFIQDGWIVMYEGIIMLVVIVAFTIFLINKGRKQPVIEEVYEIVDKAPKNWKSILFLLLGFVGLYFGADWFIHGAVGIAEEFLFDNPNKDVIIGVTIVAFGTSAPELVASTVAAYRKQTDISIGNLIGSNIFNILVVLGVTSIVTPLKVSNEAREFDLFWMVGIALLLVALIAFGSKIGRLKGAILLSTYVAYITIILLRVQGVL